MNRRRAAVPAVVLAMAACVALAPLAWMAAVSLLPARGAAGAPSLAAYRVLLGELGFGQHLVNSLIVAAAATVVTVAASAMAGHALAKIRFTGREGLSGLLLVALAVPAPAAMLPLFLLLRHAGLVNTLWGALLPSLAGVAGVLVMRHAARAVPDVLLDAARVDGAGEWRIFRSVVLPQCRPALAALALFTFVAAWGDFLWPLVVLGDTRAQTAPVALADLAGARAQDAPLVAAAAVLTLLPVLFVFAVLRRRAIEGLARDALAR